MHLYICLVFLENVCMAGVDFKSTNADSDIEENLVDTGPGCVHYKRRCAFIVSKAI